MKKLYFLLFTFLITSLAFGQTVFINEIHYDNASTDSGEGIEIAGPAGTDLSTYTLTAYNGNNGTSYDSLALTGSIPDEGGTGYGAVFFAMNGLQNGAPDAIALDKNGTIINFLSYEGSFDGVGGVADGITSEDIGVSESSGTAIGESLQLSGTGLVYANFTWNAAAASSYDLINPGQTFGTPVPTLILFDGPPNNATINISPEQVNNATTSWSTTNFVMSTDNGGGTGTGGAGFIKWSVEDISDNSIVDSGDVFAPDIEVDIPVSGLAVGESYILYAELVENDGATPITPATNYTLNVTVVDYIQVADLAALRAGTISEEVFYQVTGEVINTFSVGNADNDMYFQDSSAGIKVTDFEGFLTTSYAEGEGVLNIKGWLELNNGLLQLRPTAADWGAANSSGNTITPEVVDIYTLTDDGLAAGVALDAYESELVQINGAVFADAGGTFETAIGGTGNYDITDSSGTMQFRSIFGDYIGTTIPGGNQNLVVLVGRFFDTGQVTARRMTDFSLSTRENQIEGFSFSPNPTSLGYVNISSRSQTTMKVHVFDVLGKEVINRTVKNNKLDVSSLKTGLYIMKVSQDAATTTKKLVIQ